MDDITPGAVMSGFWRWFGTGVFALIVIGALILGGWQAGWWFSNQNVTRLNRQIQNGAPNQETLRAQITDKIGVVQQITVQIENPQNKPMAAALRAQRASVAGIACADAAQITGVPLRGQQAAWVAANCEDGNVKPTSPLYVTGAPGE